LSHKRIEELTPATIWRSLVSSSQTQKATHGTIQFTCNVQNKAIPKTGLG
jgi:hypothetical protein